MARAIHRRNPKAALLACLAILAAAVPIEAYAKALVVAIGADNTIGRGIGRRQGGVDKDEAYPARLEGMLHKQGIDARVINAGVAHDTTTGILSRLDRAVPDGTSVVILNIAKGDDKQQGADASEAGAVQGIRQDLAARHIPLIVLPPLGQIAGPYRDSDGHHFTPQGHIRIAAYLLPKVTATLRHSSQ